MGAALDGRALGGQPEGVEPGREQDVEALHPLVAGVDVGQREVPPVAQVKIAAGVREHHQGVVLGARRVDLGLVEPVGFPARLPLGLDRLVIEASAGGQVPGADRS